MEKIYLVHVWLEHPVMNLNRTFSYYWSQEVARGIRVKVSLGNREVIGFVDHCELLEETLEEYNSRAGYEVKPLNSVIDSEPVLNEELYQLGLWMAHETVSPTIACFQSMLPSKMKPRTAAKEAVKEYYVELLDAEKATTPKQKEAVKLLKDGPVLRTDFNKAFPSLLARLVKQGAVSIIAREKEAEVSELDIKEASYPLTDEQKDAIKKINEAEKDIILLHGLTGSGKTEIYMQLAKQRILEGKQVLILVPEISLTPQMVNRLVTRFGHSIAIYHSRLNNQQRYEQYQLVRNKKVQLVVGTRSAVFMPFDNLGLIVLDEEHDHSYKQESTPKYHCRDVAIFRARWHHCKVVLGSATPTLESYARTIKDVYQLVELKNRIYQQLPESHLIDMQLQMRKGNPILSEPLEKAIGERLAKNQQCILLLNRRGYTTFMRCRSCGKIIECPHCDIAMSYHKDTNLLTCHTCGFTMDADMDCPQCGAHSWFHYGLGTQRLAETIQEKFPEARILRMDADTTKGKDSHEQILKRFEKHEADILLGTQMIAKGLDYPNVTLVGIFNADALLARSDYRSVEVTFDLIVQASGRSGRGHDAGEVYVQAYNCSHYGIALAVKQDFISFFRNEMKYRHLANYPPYCYMGAILFASLNEDNCRNLAQECADLFRKEEGMKTLGPVRLPRNYDEYRYRVVLKSKDRQAMIDKIWEWFEKQNHQGRIQVDIDPYVID